MTIVSTGSRRSYESTPQDRVGHEPHASRRRFALRAAVALAAFAACARVHPADALSAAEAQRIERLLAAIGETRGLLFVRNGTSYDAATTVRFLRGKWDRYRARVGSAEDFIREIATRSETSGERYRVRRADGSEEDSAAFLGRLLASQR